MSGPSESQNLSDSDYEVFGVRKEQARPLYKPDEIKCLKNALDQRFYTHPQIKRWCKNEAELNTAPFETIVTTFNLDGSPVDINAKGPNKRIAFCSYNQFAIAREDQPPATDKEFDGTLVRVGKAWPTRKPEKCCATETFAAQTRQYVQWWKKTDFYTQVQRYIEKYAIRMAEVKSVVCFGLGRLKVDANISKHGDTHGAACYLQHYIALHIRDLIAKEQKKRKEDIPIYAQDAAYCDNCKSVLTKLGFIVVPGNTGFLKLDGNAFVVAIRPAAPVRQIVADLTRDTHGPAGILCSIIHIKADMEAEGNVDDESHPWLQGEFLNGCAASNMLVEMKPDPGSGSDDARNDSHYKVEFDDMEVPGMVFGPVGWYFKDKKFK
ncbi:hypothetical protein FB567DRAFT_576285 [Paraphoma chrysanthemicola]|uniref:SRR1-like domain-containing protein n=1 Tax=Paraphoma chrysanthemicola TaxID=798071 RepID=A0A8K0RFX1_9PLEO|nr:hypothetical protein FB567DRAFT_576285 [Paraphoma chrysanthemicola]